MHPATVAASLALASASLMAGYVVLRREKTDVHWLLLSVLLALMVWTTGIILRFSVATLEGLAVSLGVAFLGIFATPPLWLLLAARYARFPALFEHRGTWLALLLPSVAAYLGYLTNDAHGLVVRELSFEALAGGGVAWAGPVFWGFIAWSYLCVLGGGAIYLHTAKRLVAGPERMRGLVLAGAALAPLAASAVYLFRILPVSFDLTPSGLTISLALLCVALLRYQLLESLPLARRDVIEHLRDGVVMASPAGVILDLNPAAQQILGRRFGDLRRRPLQAVLAGLAEGESRRQLLESLDELEPGAPPRPLEVRTPDERRIEVAAAWVRDTHGEPAGRYALLRDRTEERRFERLVRHSQKLRTVGTLASGIAHEINNPLAFIRANLSEMRRLGEIAADHREEGDAASKLAEELADLRQIAEESLDGIDRIERIVSGMRRLASPREEAFRSVDLGEVARDALRLSNLTSDPNVGVETALQGDLPPVEGAPERLVQAVLNLLVNARQALEGRGGRVTIETRSLPDWVELQVRDNGPGIPEDLEDRIFDPFFTTKDPDQGTGLGLAITFDIVRDHGGTLEVSSAPGGGACFVARLPVS